MGNIKLKIVKEAISIFEKRREIIKYGHEDKDDVSLFLCDCISDAIESITGKEAEYCESFRNDHIPEFVELAKKEGVYSDISMKPWWDEKDDYARKKFLKKLEELVSK